MGPTTTERPRLFGRRAWYRRRVAVLEAQAVVDDVTGLRSQRALWRELDRRAASCSESSPLAVVMLDLDLFSEVNEHYGHPTGDAVLRRAAAVVRRGAPFPRLVFRYGGEEIVMLVPGGEEDGRVAAERVREEIARQNGDLPAVTVSCGVAALDEPVEAWVALDRADAAVRSAKQRGRNRVVVAGRESGTESAYLVEEIEHETARRAALALAVAALEARDAETADHCDDVLTLCESMGRQLGLDARPLERLTAGAQLHDVGKVAVPAEILNKPGPLDDHEWSVIREHTVIGERILRSVPEMAEVATIVRHSHEHWDGSGYPDGLAGDQIPLASRVILCADAFHAIRSNRPYRAGRSADEALAEVRAGAGAQFDPQVVDALAEVAAEIRRQQRANAVGAGVPRSRRLVALLATLAIGTGTAIAAIPELREAIGSLFGATTVEPHGTATPPIETAFTFGPLGDALTIAPAAATDPFGAAATRSENRAARADDRDRGARRASRSPARAAMATPRPSGGNRSHGLTGGARPRQAAPGTPRSTVDPSPGGAGSPEATTPNRGSGGSGDSGGGGTAGDPARGDGRALGRDVPTPRRPAQPPSRRDEVTPGGGRESAPGRPQDPGRTDPPALGRQQTGASGARTG